MRIKIIIKTITKALLILWQMPQVIVGSLILSVILLFEKYDEVKKIDEVFVIRQSLFCGGLSLGYFVFVSSLTENLVRHELGHSRQSKYLGWLYLVIIGLPSLLWASLARVSKKVARNYYKLYTESSADKLGGVDRYIGKSTGK